MKSDTGKLTDAATGEPIAGDAPADVDTVRLNNRLRGAIDAALGGFTLLAADPACAMRQRKPCSSRARPVRCRRWNPLSPKSRIHGSSAR